MYRKIIIVSVFFLLFILTLSNVSAQGTDSGTISATPLKKQRAELKQQLKDTISAKRLEAKTAIQTKREEFKTRMQTIKDQKKKAVVERIDTKLSTINEKHTNRFTEVLGNLQLILDKVTDKDTAAAQTAIDTARKAVETQAEKTYTIIITDEVNLKQNVGATTSQLRQDLTATHKAVIDARHAVKTLRINK